MKNFTNEELKTILKFTETLADAATGRVPDSATRNPASLNFADAKVTDSNRDSVLREAEEEARKYAAKRNQGKGYRSDAFATQEEKSISASVKQWLQRQRKRGHKI
jgi:hypothetical protein